MKMTEIEILKRLQALERYNVYNHDSNDYPDIDREPDGEYCYWCDIEDLINEIEAES